jgi:hypothetical protein
MSTDILQRFLNRRLFDIGPDDTRLDRVRKAAGELASSLLEKRSETVRYALVAFDPDIPTDEPVLADVSKIVENHWNTYLSCFADTPRSLLRAVLLEALRQAQEKDIGIASAVALTARNVLPHFPVSSEREVWDDLVLTAETRSEEQARVEWGTELSPHIPSVSKSTLKASGITAAKVDSAALTNKLRSASGPFSPPDSNPHWPNNPQAWAQEFANRASSGIAEVVDKAFEESSKGTVEANKTLLTSVDAHMKEVSSVIEESLKQVAGSAAGPRLRADLLWWKEALYSPLAKQSYRSYPAAVAALLMAVDLHRQVPTFCPESVEHFLRETVTNLVGSGGAGKKEPTALSQIIEGFVKGNPPTVVLAELAALRQTKGRMPLVAFVAGAIAAGTVHGDLFLPAVGVKGNNTFALGDVAVWIFRELQAIRAVSQPKQKASK